jgi:hypothetical protein
MMESKPQGGWTKVLGLVGLVLLALYGTRMLKVLGSIDATFIIAASLAIALAMGAYMILGGETSDAGDQPETEN